MPDSSNNVNSGVRASAVDWSRPIEAVHPDGRVVPVTLGRRDETMDSSIFVNGYRQRVHFDGKEDWAADWGGLHLIRAWRIRNVQPTTPERDPALWDRMVALVTRMAADNRRCFTAELDEARAIVADLPKPVDPDLIEAREIVVAMEDRPLYSWEIREGRNDGHALMRVALAAIKRGRELAAPEVSHVG